MRRNISLHMTVMLIKTAPHVRNIIDLSDEDLKGIACGIGYKNMNIDMMKNVFKCLHTYSDEELVDMFFQTHNILSATYEE